MTAPHAERPVLVAMTGATGAVYGIRVLVPISRILSLPLIGKVLAAGEWWARDSFLRQFGAHLLAVLRKPDPNAGRIAHP